MDEGGDALDAPPVPVPTTTPSTLHSMGGIDSTEHRDVNDVDSTADPDADNEGFQLVQTKRKKVKTMPNNTSNLTKKANGMTQKREPIAPRERYIRLAFPEDTTSVDKIRWMREVSQLPPLQEEGPLDMVQGRWISSRYVYVRREQQQYVAMMINGTFAGISLQNKDEFQPKKKKYGEYLVTRFPKEAAAEEALHLPGVFKARRIYKNGQPLNRLIIVWSGEQPPPTEYQFFGRYIEPSSIRPWCSEVVVCYKCQGYGHVAKYCRKDTACAVCAGAHQAKDCPARNDGKDNDNEDAATIVKRCVRCRAEGVTAWHRNCPHKPPRAPPPPAPTVPIDRGVAMPSPATHTHPGPRDVTNPQEFPQLPGGFPILGNSATGETIGEKDMDTAEEIRSIRQEIAEMKKSIRQEIAELKKMIMENKSDRVDRENVRSDDVSDVSDVENTNEVSDIIITHDKSERVDRENVRSDDVSDVENTNEVSDIIITHVRSDDVSDVSDADNTNEVSDIIITHGGPSENSDDSDRKNDADEDAKETADLWDITQKMLSELRRKCESLRELPPGDAV